MNIDETVEIIQNAIPEEVKTPQWQPLKDAIILDDPPPFPLEALPKVLRDMAEGISLSRKVPVAMAATALLSAVGMAIGRNVYFRRKRGFEGRANLYAFVFAARGERKSVTFRPALLPFYKWMDSRDVRYRKEMQNYSRNLTLMKNIEDCLAKPGGNAPKRRELAQELEMLEHEIGEMPRNPWFLTDDTTPEALFKLMKETGGSAGIFSDDARLMVKMLLGNVYSNSGEGREEFLLRPFEGEQPLIRRRVGTGLDHIERPCIGMLLMLQTDFLKKIGSAISFFESGLASRCLFCYPESWVGKRDENGILLRADDDYEIPLAAENAYRDLIFDLLDRAYESDTEVYYSLSPEALAEWKKFYHEIESESGAGGIYDKIQDIAIRYPTLMLRLALILAVIEKRSDVGLSNVVDAQRIMRYYMASAKRCSDAMRGTGFPDNARRIIAFWHKVLAGNPHPVSVRDIEYSLKMSKSDVDEALQVLIERNYCRYLPQESSEGKKGRKPSPKLEINPQFFE